MCKKFVLMFIVLGLVSLGNAALLDDFESGLGNWVGNEGCTVTWGTNPVTGSNSMIITPDGANGENNFSWGAHESIPIETIDFATTPIIQLEVSWVASEWAGLDWLNQEQFSVNSGPAGWTQVVADDPLNPSWPGSWDPSWGDHTRTLQFDFSAMPVPSEWGTQMNIAVNWGNTTSGLPGNFYIDNIQTLTPEPATIALLGMGGLALLRRKR